MVASSLQMSTTIMCLFFGTNLFLFLFFVVLQRQKKESLELVVKKSEAFKGTAKCYTLLTAELCRVGFIMALTYICERHWFFEHSGKSYDRDLFMFVCLIFFGYGYMTITPIKDLALLGREQTEEWKGWMQFIFLLYHYFHAEEVYNSVRVMITCYVWMTGFGNFSFFYIKQDFGWLRVVQMLWRLNFAVIFLMMTHGNTYILYYICPLHTFFFLMVYATMFIGSSLNHGKWSIRWKLALLGCIIYLIWDFNHGIFQFLFQWLGTEPQIGAGAGSVWEWYFRTSLDHWSTYFGMIFALNFPLCEQLFVKLKGWPLYFVAAVLGALSVWWYVNVYSLDKLNYNLHHNYFAFIPLTAYIYFRNMTPYLRSFVSYSFHDIGKTTLETYLLQHHVWLTSNAKTLLTIVPGYPWVTFFIASITFLILAKELYRLTMTIRGMILPDDKKIALKNIIGFIAVFLIFSVAGMILFYAELNSLAEIGFTCALLFVVSLWLIGLGGGMADDVSFRSLRIKAVPAGAVVAVVCIMLGFHSMGMGSEGAAPSSARRALGAPAAASDLNCLPFVTDGAWHYNTACSLLVPGGGRSAYCQTESWLWNTADSQAAGCKRHFSSLNTDVARKMLNGKRMLFCGDSGIRSLYHSMNQLLDPSYDQTAFGTGDAVRHADMSNVFRSGDGNDVAVSVEFKWAPRVANMSECFAGQAGEDDVHVIGMVLWDALWGRDVGAYTAEVSTQLPAIGARTALWVHPQRVVNANLRTAEKQQYMSEEIVSTYRAAFDEVFSSSGSNLSSVINPASISGTKPSSSVDGVHYSQDVYDTTVQVVLNALAVIKPRFLQSASAATAAAPSKAVPKPPDSMSFPGWGAMVLATAIVMLFSMDSFFGIGYFAILISGRSLDYDAAYLPLLKKIFGTGARLSPAVPVEVEISPVAADDDAEETAALLHRSADSGEKEGKV